MPGNLGFLPGCQFAIGLGQQFFDLALQPADFLGDVKLAGSGDMTEFLNLAFKFGDGFFKIEIGLHDYVLAQAR